jgi:DNA-binding MarR family transcriptional regulator
MNRDTSPSVPVGPALRRAWVGYQLRVDDAMKAAGFDDRQFPDGRVLRMCAESTATTISQIGRELGITRQGAGKIIASLRERRYVKLVSSATDGREKIVTLTPRAVDYLAAQRRAARTIERSLQRELGPDGLAGLHRLLEVLGGGAEVRMRDYLRNTGLRES